MEKVAPIVLLGLPFSMRDKLLIPTLPIDVQSSNFIFITVRLALISLQGLPDQVSSSYLAYRLVCLVCPYDLSIITVVGDFINWVVYLRNHSQYRWLIGIRHYTYPKPLKL